MLMETISGRWTSDIGVCGLFDSREKHRHVRPQLICIRDLEMLDQDVVREEHNGIQCESATYDVEELLVRRGRAIQCLNGLDVSCASR